MISSFFFMCFHIFKMFYNCKMLILYSDKFFSIKKRVRQVQKFKKERIMLIKSGKSRQKRS